jgi:hypothetical protein
VGAEAPGELEHGLGQAEEVVQRTLYGGRMAVHPYRSIIEHAFDSTRNAAL